MKIYLCGNFQGSERESKREREKGGQCTDTHYNTRSNKRERKDIEMKKYEEKIKYRKEKISRISCI